MSNVAHDDALIRAVYRCCSGHRQWADALDEVGAQFDAQHVMLQVLTRDGERLRGLQKYCGSNHEEALYKAIKGEDNPRLDEQRFLNRAMDKVVDDDDLFDARDRHRIRDFRQRLALVNLGTFIGGLTHLDGDYYLGVALHRSLDDTRAFSGGERDRLVRLIPHLAQSVLLDTQIRASTSRDAVLSEHARLSPFAMLVCGADARVRWMNHRAAQLMPGLHRDSALDQPLLTAWRSAQTNELRRLVSAQVTDAKAPTYLVLEGPSGRIFHVAILAPNLEHCPDGVLITMSCPEWTAEVPLGALQTLFGLTESESLLARDLAGGATVEAHSRERSISVGTTRWYLKQVLAKTGAARQQDLVRLLLSSSASQMQLVKAIDRR